MVMALVGLGIGLAAAGALLWWTLAPYRGRSAQ